MARHLTFAHLEGLLFVNTHPPRVNVSSIFSKRSQWLSTSSCAAARSAFRSQENFLDSDISANDLVRRNPSFADAESDGYLYSKDTLPDDYAVVTTAKFSTLYVLSLFQYDC